jgi:hypothetical protein
MSSCGRFKRRASAHGRGRSDKSSDRSSTTCALGDGQVVAPGGVREVDVLGGRREVEEARLAIR